MFNLVSRTNETRHIKWHETCKCKGRLDSGVCNNKQRWNSDKYSSKCKELIGKGVCDKGFIWNPCNCECEWDTWCDVGEFLDYENSKCRKSLLDKLLAECTENIEEVKTDECHSVEDKNKHKMQFLHAVHCVIFNNLYNQHRHWYLFWLLQIHDCNKENVSRYDYVYQATNYHQYKWENSSK